MINAIKRVLLRLFYHHRADEKSYITYLRKNGARIGERVRIFDPHNTIIDSTRPWMISIGNDVQITSGVTILTHGYDWSVLKGVFGEVIGSCGEVCIGNNCFIGMNSTILKGVHIGDNCIIGANSLVNKDCESGWIFAGQPAKKIMTIEEYMLKRMNSQLQEAKELYKCYVRSFCKEPPEELFDEFFWLFKKRTDKLSPGQKAKMDLLGNSEMTWNKYNESVPLYCGYDDFLKKMRADNEQEE